MIIDGISSFFFEKRVERSNFYYKLPSLLYRILHENKMSLIVTKPLLFRNPIKNAESLVYDELSEHLGSVWGKSVNYRILLHKVGIPNSSKNVEVAENVVWVEGRLSSAQVKREHLEAKSQRFAMCLTSSGIQVLDFPKDVDAERDK